MNEWYDLVLFDVCSAQVYKEMDQRTRDFLATITTMLRQHYSVETSSGHLNQLIDHLGQFYDDVVAELAEKKKKCENDIEGMSG